MSELHKNIAIMDVDIEKAYEVEFSDVDDDTRDYLIESHVQIVNVQKSASFELGRIFSKVRDRLSNNKNGVFEKWYSKLGFTKTGVYRHIGIFNFLESKEIDLSEKKAFLALPQTLQYEVSNSKTDDEIKHKILSGEIENVKQLQEVKSIGKTQSKPISGALRDDITMNFYPKFINVKLKGSFSEADFKELQAIIEQFVETNPTDIVSGV